MLNTTLASFNAHMPRKSLPNLQGQKCEIIFHVVAMMRVAGSTRACPRISYSEQISSGQDQLPVALREMHCVRGGGVVSPNILSVQLWTCCKVRIASYATCCYNFFWRYDSAGITMGSDCCIALALAISIVGAMIAGPDENCLVKNKEIVTHTIYGMTGLRAGRIL